MTSNLNGVSRLALLIGIGILSAGCAPRIVSIESYNAAMTPNHQGPYVMDPGSYGGTAYASGGTKPGMSFGTGATEDKFEGHAIIGAPSHFKELKQYAKDHPANWTVEGQADASDKVGSTGFEKVPSEN